MFHVRVVLFFSLCGILSAPVTTSAEQPASERSESADREEPQEIASLPPAREALLEVPLPNLDTLEEAVRDQLQVAQDSLSAVVARKDIPDDELVEAYALMAQLYHAYRLADSAEACYLNAIRLRPESFQWVYLLAYLYEQEGRLDEAAAHYTRSLQLWPQSLAAQVNLGELYHEQNRLDEAQKAFQAALAVVPDCAAAHFGLGQIALSRREHESAVRYLETALTAVPEANRIHYPLAMAYRGMGELEKARFHLGKRGTVGIRAPDPLVEGLHELLQGERVHLLRGRLAFQARHYRKAAVEFQSAVAARPESARARVNLGTVLGLLGDVEGAMEQYHEALLLDPESPTVHYNLGHLLARKGRHAEAAEHFQRVIQIEPNDVQAHLQLAEALQRVGRDAEALERCAAVLQHDPGNGEALLLMVKLLLRQSRYRDALERLEEAHERSPAEGRTAHALARLLAACPDRSLRDGPRALELAGQVYDAMNTAVHAETVVLALAETGRCEQAASWQDRAITIAEETRDLERASRLKQGRARYEQGKPCHPPGFGEPAAAPE